MGSQQACCANWDAAAPDRQHRAFAGEQRMLGPSDAPCIATEGAKTAAVIRHMPRLPFLAKVQPAERGIVADPAAGSVSFTGPPARAPATMRFRPLQGSTTTTTPR